MDQMRSLEGCVTSTWHDDRERVHSEPRQSMIEGPHMSRPLSPATAHSIAGSRRMSRRAPALEVTSPAHALRDRSLRRTYRLSVFSKTLLMIVCCVGAYTLQPSLEVNLSPMISFEAMVISPASATPSSAKLEKRRADLQLKLERTPDDSKALYMISQLLLKLKRPQEALNYLRHLTALPAQTPPLKTQLRGRYLLAFTYRQLKRYPEAIETYQEYIKVVGDSPEQNEAYFGLGKTYELMGDPVAAVESYERFINLEKRPKKLKYVRVAQKAMKRLKTSNVISIERDRSSEFTLLEDTSSPSVPPSTSSPASDPPQSDSSTQSKGTPPATVTSKTEAQRSKAQPAKDRSTQGSPSKSSNAPRPPITPTQNTLSEADLNFESGRYQLSAQIYRTLSQDGTKGSALDRQQLLYQAATSAFLAERYDEARADAERGLLNTPDHPLFKALAVLSHLHKKDTGTLDLSEVKIALKEGRFEDALSLSRTLIKRGGPKGFIANMRRAEGVALMGLKRYEEALVALKASASLFRHPLLTFDLARAAESNQKLREARGYYQELRDLTQRPSGQPLTPLHQLALDALNRLRSP